MFSGNCYMHFIFQRAKSHAQREEKRLALEEACQEEDRQLLKKILQEQVCAKRIIDTTNYVAIRTYYDVFLYSTLLMNI